MKVETVPEQKPEVSITMSWQEAEILRDMCGGTSSGGLDLERDFIHTLNQKLQQIGLRQSTSRRRFHGKFDA